MAETSEKDIEKYLREQCEKLGGKAYKWVCPGNIGVPDRICLFPFGLIVFIEVKAPGKTVIPNSPQSRRLTELHRFGFIVAVVDSKEKVDYIIEKIRVSLMELAGLAKKNLEEAKAKQEAINAEQTLRDNSPDQEHVGDSKDIDTQTREV